MNYITTCYLLSLTVDIYKFGEDYYTLYLSRPGVNNLVELIVDKKKLPTVETIFSDGTNESFDAIEKFLETLIKEHRSSKGITSLFEKQVLVYFESYDCVTKAMINMPVGIPQVIADGIFKERVLLNMLKNPNEFTKVYIMENNEKKYLDVNP